MLIRPTMQEDIPALQLVLDGTELFPSEMLPNMLYGFLSDRENVDVWLTLENEKGTPIGFCYASPEQLADRTWNMLAIAVLPEQQGTGVGGAIVSRLENVLRERGQRILVAETSGTDNFERARSFYRKNGYVEEARIRDFWAPGDDKVVFWKAL